METTPYPIKRLDRTEFAAALRKGQGRARLHVLHYGLDDVADLVLEACLHNQVYDQDLESGRGPWLFSMFQDTPHYPEFREAILNALYTATEDKDLFQLAQLAGEFAKLGDQQACQDFRDIILENAAEPDGSEWCVETFLNLEGAKGMLQLARRYGKRLIADPNDSVNSYLLQYEGHPDFPEILSEYSMKDAAINTYKIWLENWEKQNSSWLSIDNETRKKQNHESIRNEYSLHGILEDAKAGKGSYPGHYVSFGHHAPENELEIVYSHLLAESSDQVRTRLLWVFRRAKLPHLDQELFDWANGTNNDLRAAAISALAQVSDPKVHALARMKAETRSLLGADNEALNLFILNYDSSDTALVTNSLVGLQPDPDDAHSLGFSIQEIAEKHEDQDFTEAMLWVYENTPCAFCRYQAVSWLNDHHKLSAELRFECQYDADDSLWGFAQGS